MRDDMRAQDHEKEAIKEALSDWLDDKFAEFGRFSLKGILAVSLVAVVYLWSASQGWTIK
tara:strand:- start:843 stop:1022 length:180 start_codon:yes stop_codon:yes gene_type:complete